VSERQGIKEVYSVLKSHSQHVKLVIAQRELIPQANNHVNSRHSHSTV